MVRAHLGNYLSRRVAHSRAPPLVALESSMSLKLHFVNIFALSNLVYSPPIACALLKIM
jgi:hypothetical protein